jgi:P-type E1-E2 ATPase
MLPSFLGSGIAMKPLFMQFRDGSLTKLDHSELVPGDVVELSQGSIHCDMLLLTGDAIVDEAALTGEATPQAKVAIDPFSRNKYDQVEHKRHTLFAGTTLVECDNSRALVVKTASYTTKGGLMREIIAFRTHRVQLSIDFPIVIALLTAYTTAIFIYVFFNSSDEPVVAWTLGM